jgi:hypothetical protein
LLSFVVLLAAVLCVGVAAALTAVLALGKMEIQQNCCYYRHRFRVNALIILTSLSVGKVILMLIEPTKSTYMVASGILEFM